jgi:APA family basic amino acid/polyamine antiporter
MFVMFAYSGWNSATYIGSEIKSPGKVIPRSLLISTGIVTILYVLLNIFFVYALSPGEIKGVPEIAGLAAGKAFGKMAEAVISLLISFALVSSLSAFIILGPRVYYSMTREGYFFAFAAKIHPKFKVPVGAVLLQSSIAVFLVATGTFEQILVYMGFSLGIFPIIAVAGIFKLRLKKESSLKLPGFPFVQILFIVTGLLMLILAFFERPYESSIAILTALSGIPVFYWFKRRRV